ncbi:enoyl-CoA hydratase-related protein [Nocardia sp. NBC_00508]|uniref:enoyl-CoA hydratase-related protein n=1 Tax=Nocardia sp. NBC_00508 TaxID=2975992 RepID=UPI002E7FDEC8|nr:enoyl-CoA hydratase-related protein [Nocardia sp. NBC_00508]WUD64779.1 enoyl-CoA hydratase-related protein [Nocardia sp. NBC_00508]
MSRTAPTGTITAEIRDGVGWIELSNPLRRNAISTQMMTDLAEALYTLDDNPTATVIVIRGAGTSAFAAGADISEFESQQTTTEARDRADSATAAMFDALSTVSTPTIAMIHGYCIGAGVAIALGTDIRIAATGSCFAIPAARLGIGYPLPQVRALLNAAGPGIAAEILFTGRRYDALTALRTGLVNHVVGPAELESTVAELARTIATNAPLSVRAAKAALKSVLDAENSAARTAAQALIAACNDSTDALEGQRAFLEKRPPRFAGG